MFKRLGRLWLALLLGIAPTLARAADPTVAPTLAHAAEPEAGPTPEDPAPFPPHRFALVGGGVLLLGGVGLGLYARSEVRSAQQALTARDTSQSLDRARDAGASANLLYGVAGMTLLYGLLLEFLPPPAAEKASLTFHF